MSDLPDGWAKASVSDVAASMFDGPFGSALKTADYTESGVRVARLENIGHLRFRSELASYISEEKFGTLLRHTLRADDVLFSSFVDRQTRVCLVPDELDAGMINKADCFCIRVDRAACEPKFLAYYLASPTSYETFAGAVRGVTRPRIGLRDLASFEIRLPPRAEQKRIVAKLDALFARTMRARSDLDRVVALAARYRQGVLAAAFRGQLKRRGGDDSAPSDWRHERATDVCAKVQSGGTPKAGFATTGIPFLKVYNIVGQQVSFDYRPQYVGRNTHAGELRKSMAKPGDVIMNIVGPPLGKVAIIPPEFPEWNINQALTIFRPSDRVTSKWLYYFLCGGDSVQSVINETRGSAGQVNISLSQCRNFVVPVPSLDEQADIVDRIETALAEIDRLAAEAASALKLLDRLDQAVLAKAFRGELVPQNLTDEPASVLLDRIRAEREAAPKAKRGRKPKEAA